MEQQTRRLRAADLVLGSLLALSCVVAVALADLHWLTAVGVGAVAFVGPALARIDLAMRRLPNPLTLPVLVVAALVAAAHAVSGNWLGPAIAVGCAALLAVMAFAGGMGMGDVKLGAAIVLAVSATPWAPVAAISASFVLGGVAGCVMLALGHRRLPFGPFLLAGLLVALVFDCFVP